MAHTLMISQRLADHRIWGDIPARLSGITEIVFYDQNLVSAAGSSPDLEIRKLLPPNRGAFDVVAGAEDAARLAVGMALDGLARGLVLFQPALDGIPEELERVDFSDLEERTRLFAPLVTAVDEPDPVKWQSLVVDVVDQAIGIHLTPNDAALVRDVISGHAGEYSTNFRTPLPRAPEARDGRCPHPGKNAGSTECVRRRSRW